MKKKNPRRELDFFVQFLNSVPFSSVVSVPPLFPEHEPQLGSLIRGGILLEPSDLRFFLVDLFIILLAISILEAHVKLLAPQMKIQESNGMEND